MQIELTYNNEPMNLNLPDRWTVDCFRQKTDDSALGYDHFVESLEKSGNSEIFNTDSLLIVVNDAHRSTPTAQVLEWLTKWKPSLVGSADFLIACGTHKLPDESEKRKIFGALFDSVSSRITSHDCHKKEEMKLIGQDSNGHDCFVNKKLFEYKHIFLINSIEPHYFAGYTGGRKSIVPGLADFETIERNHNLANSLECMPLRLQGNPMAEHLESIVANFNQDNIFTLQIVYDNKKRIKNFFFGSLKDAFQAGVTHADEMYAVSIAGKYDAAILEILPPLDANIYQAQKALENNQIAVADNGVAIILSACADGIGSEFFFKLAESWDAELNRPKDGKLHFGSHKLARVNQIGKRITAGLCSLQPDEIVSKVFYKPIKNIQNCLEEKAKEKNNYRVAVVYDAAHTVLTI
ncbi:MAG: nickel-dependent lactate racemase [Calditrichaeota bacterium]|nr:MAG: nickel-dependent lactate racemase [Calditrichota bacterium]